MLRIAGQTRQSRQSCQARQSTQSARIRIANQSIQPIYLDQAIWITRSDYSNRLGQTTRSHISDPPGQIDMAVARHCYVIVSIDYVDDIRMMRSLSGVTIR